MIFLNDGGFKNDTVFKDKQLINQILKNIEGQIRPINDILKKSNPNYLNPKKIGNYIALLYVCKNNKNFITHDAEHRYITLSGFFR